MEIQLEKYTFYRRKLMWSLYVDREENEKKDRIKWVINEKKTCFCVFACFDTSLMKITTNKLM